MKITLAALIIAMLLILDQMKTGGYYTTSGLNAIEQAVIRIVRVFR